MPVGAGILFPSGEDANPLNRRLPAEVVTRKRAPAPKKVEEKPPDEVEVDLKVALALKSDARIKWLGKACNMAQEGRASTTDLYDIITNRKFAVGVHPKVGRKIRDVVRDILSVFSDKQQRHLTSDDWLFNSSVLEKTAPVLEPPAAPAADSAAADAADAAVAAARAPAALAADSAASDDRLVKPRMFFEKPAVDKASADKASADRAAAPEKGGWVVAPRQPERAPGPEDRGGWSVVEDRRRKVTDRENRERLLEQEEQAKKEKERVARQKLEAQVDDSMMLLERLEKKKQHEPEPDKASSRRRGRSRSRERGRSRSVSVQAMRSRSRSRRRRGDKKMDKATFSEALKRRLAEREARDTTRIPVVDPDHAKRWS